MDAVGLNRVLSVAIDDEELMCGSCTLGLLREERGHCESKEGLEKLGEGS
jgi:hypothetical protein